MNKKKRHLKREGEERPSNHFLCNKVANRLEKMGYKPFRSEAERYLVTIPEGDAAPEIVEIGKAWRGGRIFRNNFVGKDAKLIEQFGDFAKSKGLKDCYFWNVSLTGCKASIESLVADVERFNADINTHFSELRKKHGFEQLALALHFRYDEHQDAIDLHAHFVCRVPSDQLEATRQYLRTKFSLPYLDLDPIENAEAVLNYMLFGIFDIWEMVDWPDHALAAIWEMTQHKRYHYVRTGGRFATWRKQLKAANQNGSGNQRPARSAFVPRPGQSRFLARVKARIRGKRVPALLFERAVESQARPSAARVYSTASCVTTQGTATDRKAGRNELDVCTKNPLRALKMAFKGLSRKIASKFVLIGNAIVRRMRT